MKIEVVAFWIYFEGRINRISLGLVIRKEENVCKVFGLRSWKDEV